MTSPLDAHVTTLEPMTLATLRHIGPYPGVGAKWEQLCAWAGPKGLLTPSTVMLGLYYDDPQTTPPEALRCDACLTVAPGTPVDQGVVLQEFQGGTYAMAIHKGSYENLAQTYMALIGQWMPENNLQPDHGEPCAEIYVNNPQMVPEDELLTKVYCKIVK